MMPLTAPLTVQEIHDIDGLREFRAPWRSLLAQTPNASFFQSASWLEPYWNHFGDGQKLRVHIVFSSGEPIGIVPLVVRRVRTRLGTMRTLTYPLDNWGSFFGPVGPEPRRTLATCLQHVRNTPRDWDVIDLPWTSAEAKYSAEIAEGMRDAGCAAIESTWDQSSLVDLQGDWESYLADRTSKWRNNLRRCERRVGELGRVEYLRYRPGGGEENDADPRLDLYDSCEQIALRSWQGRSENGTTLSHASVRLYLRDAHLAAVEAGAADLNLLLIDGQPRAFAYNYHFQGHVSGLRNGYDPILGNVGAGNLLYARMIQDSFQRGDRVFDLGVGSVEIKRYFRTRLCTASRFSYYHPAVIRGHLLRLKRRVDQWRSRKSSAGP